MEKRNFRHPQIFHSTEKFWLGLRDRKFLIQRCKNCEEIFFPPRSHCPKCLYNEMDWVELSGKGTLYSWSEIHIPSRNFDVPYVIGIIDLEEGVGRMVSKIRARVEDLKIDMPMKIDYEDAEEDLTLYVWMPAQS